MKCPFCGHAATQVIDTRMSEEGDTVRRRRRCESCDRRFTTYERIELFFPAVVKKNGSRVDYDRNKVKDSMRLALRKRPVSAEAIDEAIARIEVETPHLRLDPNFQSDFGRTQAAAWYGILAFGSVWNVADDGKAKIVAIRSL